MIGKQYLLSTLELRILNKINQVTLRKLKTIMAQPCRCLCALTQIATGKRHLKHHIKAWSESGTSTDVSPWRSYIRGGHQNLKSWDTIPHLSRAVTFLSTKSERLRNHESTIALASPTLLQTGCHRFPRRDYRRMNLKLSGCLFQKHFITGDYFAPYLSCKLYKFGFSWSVNGL